MNFKFNITFLDNQPEIYSTCLQIQQLVNSYFSIVFCGWPTWIYGM